MAKHKSETQKPEKSSTSRTYRKSPGRSEKSQSPASSPIRNASHRSPARKGSRSPGRSSPVNKGSVKKSPTRESPARLGRPRRTSPGRSSPVTKSSGKSPTRESPGRLGRPRRTSPGRSSPVDKRPVPKSPTRRSAINKSTVTRETKSIKEKLLSADSRQKYLDDSESDSVDVKKIIEEKPKAAVRGRSRKLESGFLLPRVILQDIQIVSESASENEESQTRLLRRSARKSILHSEDNLEHSNLQFKKLTEFSDDDDKVQFPPNIRDTSERCSESKVLVEHFSKNKFGGWVAILIYIITLPLLLMGLNIVCDKTQCSYTSADNFWLYKSLSHFIDSQSFLVVSAFLLLMAILQVLPFGGAKVTGLPNRHGRLDYVTNSFFSIIFTSTTVIALEYFKVPVTAYVLSKYFQLFVSSLILGVMLAVCLFIRSFYVPVSALNLYGTTKSQIYNFWVGREVNPRPLGILDVKMLLIKVISTGTVIINGAYIYHSISTSKSFKLDIYNINGVIALINFNANVIVLGTMQILYALDLAIFEYALLTGYRIQYEGVGYLTCVRGMTVPFLWSIITKYTYEHNEHFKMWQCILSLLLFLIGYILYRRSNLEKHAFRQNPYNPALSNLKTIPTSRSKKLLVSGYWGFLQHPNYLGDILIHLSFALFAWNAPASLAGCGTIIFLIYRASMDAKECKQKYGGAWNRYCQRVKYVLFPGIY